MSDPHNDHHDRLVRLEERFKAFEKRVDAIVTGIAKLVTKEELWPVKALIYGLVSVMLTAVVVALVAQVVK